ncbi:hypothetical protein KM043_018632 [Ampulex compressa]|nr:hypothetical protein KM043_018632 [Ampulex compressa]
MKVDKSASSNIFLNPPPKDLEKEFHTLLTSDAINFLINLVVQFESEINNLYNKRLGTRYVLNNAVKIPSFVKSAITESNWKIAPVSKKLQNRHLDLGDVSPADTNHFFNALRANVQGVQVDFDDGHCPTWRNQILGLHNVYQVIHNQLPDVPHIIKAPILMLRPRAWNMIEHNMSINGREIPGPLFDFGLLMFHNAHILSDYGVGPYFYLSKLESTSEAHLWNKIFIWSQAVLGIPYGTIKACVLIENILSSFEMDHILYELRDHSLGLNCGIWDYAASIISKFGGNKHFLLPDRNKYVNMNKHFLKKYMQLVIQTCHKRGAHATGGMAADLLPKDKHTQEYDLVIQKVCKSKLMEIQAGIDGFMVYDIELVPHMNGLWEMYGIPFPNQITYRGECIDVTEADLLMLPKGGVTLKGLNHNITVAILFIFNWLNGKGHFAYNGSIEDSATAEISRAQIWQWIRHQALLEDNNEIVTRKLVQLLGFDILEALLKLYGITAEQKTKLNIAFDLFDELINHRDFPEFITTYLNNEHIFRRLHASL